MSLKQFVEQYDRAIRNKIEKEVQADHKSISTIVRCATHFGIEKKFQQAYTNKKFQKEFQKEMAAVSYYRTDVIKYDHPGMIYRVSEQVALGNNQWKRREFVVLLVREDFIVSCACNLFEFRGILCRHVLKVLVDLDVHHVPERYVLRRWRKDVCRAHTKIVVGDIGWKRTPKKEREDKFLRTAVKMCELIFVDEEFSDSVMGLMEQKISEFSISHRNKFGGEHYVHMVGDSALASCPANGSFNILDPPLVTRKGAPKRNRLQGALEKAKKKKSATRTPRITILEE